MNRTSRFLIPFSTRPVDHALGDITQYDVPRKLVVVESDILYPQGLLVPFSAIKSVDRDTLTVSLALPNEVVLKEHEALSQADVR